VAEQVGDASLAVQVDAAGNAPLRRLEELAARKAFGGEVQAMNAGSMASNIPIWIFLPL